MAVDRSGRTDEGDINPDSDSRSRDATSQAKAAESTENVSQLRWRIIFSNDLMIEVI